MPYQPGQSGHPEGKPRGSGKWQKFWARVTQADVAELVDSLLRDAKAGDKAAAKLILDRVSPPLKAVSAPMAFDLPPGADLAEQARAILEAASNGRLPISCATELISALSGVVALKRADEFHERLKAVEESIHGRY